MIESTSSWTKAVGVEGEFLYGPRHHLLQKLRTRHVGVLGQPRLEPAGNAGRLGHAADTGRQVEHALALGDRELSEQEESLARLGRNPVRVAATGVEVRDRRFLADFDATLARKVLDLERAQFFVFLECHVVHRTTPGKGSDNRSCAAHDISMMMTMPQIVSRVLPTA
jgi:hypothetical protein